MSTNTYLFTLTLASTEKVHTLSLIKFCLIVFYHFQLSLIYREREIYKLEEISTQVGPVKEEELENVIQAWKNSKKLARPAETRNGQSRKKTLKL